MKRKHLPVFGVGPMIVCVMMILEIIGIILVRRMRGLDSGEISVLKIPFFILGMIFIGLGITLWCLANFKSKIDVNIKSNSLVTSGVYGMVRNPIYAGIAIALTGILLLFNNLWLLVLPVIFWLWMTVILKMTEEKWLLDLYGQEYVEYCKRVNRCIPWFIKRT